MKKPMISIMVSHVYQTIINGASQIRTEKKLLHYNNYAAFSIDGKQGLIDSNGKEIVPAKYDIIFTSEYSNFITVSINGKWGCLNKKGEEVIELKYEDILELYNNLIAVKLDGKWGILNTKNEVIQPFKYDSIEPVNDDEAEAYIGKTLYKINYKGEASPK